MSKESSFQVYNASAGSGKTFTLVKEYLKILLTSESVYAFQKILAITFTNKAAAEMKERVLKNLRDFSNGEENDMFLLLSKEANLKKQVLREKSQKVLDSILQNYSAFNITTIDSFTYKLIRTFSYDLGLPLNFEVEMDGKNLIREAVDVLVSKIGVDKELTEILIAFSLEKIEEDKAWDISKELNEIATILLNEGDVAEFDKLKSKSLKDFTELNKSLIKRKNTIAQKFIEKGNEGLEIIESTGLKHNDFFRSYLPNFFKKLGNIKTIKYNDIKFDGDLDRTISEGVLYSKSKSATVKNAIDAVSEKLIALYYEAETLYTNEYSKIVLIDLVCKSLTPLGVLNKIYTELEQIKEQNNIRLNAEFNQVISNKIIDEPAPFIYERLGEKYQHYFIDEMQDTSQLQWQNLIPLIGNALSQEKGSLMLVGDAKQAIYRWRGGKAEQFINLSSEEELSENSNPFYVPKEALNLEVNYRSYSEVIRFNNSFFKHVSKFLENDRYNQMYFRGNNQEVNSKEGGFVQLDFLSFEKQTSEEKQERYAEKVLETILKLTPETKKSDICILVRKKKEGIAIANFLSENKIPIISSETLLLQNSDKVQFIVDALTYIQNPRNKDSKLNLLFFLYGRLGLEKGKHFFYKEFIDLDVEAFFDAFQKYGFLFELDIFLKLPFYESIEMLIRAFNLIEVSDAYVQAFLDFSLEYQRKKHSELQAFLELWEQKKENLSIAVAEGIDAVRIMTVHKSKGLEFPIVIFPCDLDVYYEINPKVWYADLEEDVYQGFPTSLVSCTEKLSHIGEYGNGLITKRKEELALDNFNLLYVALTRPVEQLYLITELNLDKKTASEKTNYYSGMFVNFLKSLEGENSWNSEKRTYTFGDCKRREEEEVAEGEVKPLQNSFVSTTWDSHEIQIVSNASELWGTSQSESISYGVIIHEMMSKIITFNDVDKVLNEYLLSGMISSSVKKEYKKVLEAIVRHDQLKKYFARSKGVFTEREILTKKGDVLIPDRLNFYGNRVVVIDYKTGGKLEGHKKQIEGYAAIIQEMGFEIELKLLVYVDEEVFVEVF